MVDNIKGSRSGRGAEHAATGNRGSEIEPVFWHDHLGQREQGIRVETRLSHGRIGPMLKSYLYLILSVGVFSLGGRVLSAQEIYKVGKQDVLKIEVAGDTEFSRDAATVSETGTVSLPIMGEVKVEGLSLQEIVELIRSSLVERQLLTQPVVTVSVREYKSQSITILGEVKSAGKYYLKGSEKLFDKVVEAGGLTPNAGEIVITRMAPEGTRNIAVNPKDLIGNTTVLKSGDVILVQTKPLSQVYVSGEVVSGRALAYVEGMTLSQAILMAGGLNRFGSKSRITLKRISGGKEILTKANLGNIEKGKAKDIPLLPSDTIIVGRRVF